jgi:signal transduction histidine kinase
VRAIRAVWPAWHLPGRLDTCGNAPRCGDTSAAGTLPGVAPLSIPADAATRPTSAAAVTAFDTARRVRVVGTAFLRTRPLIVGPAMAAFAAVLAGSGAPRGQLAALAPAMAALLALFVAEAVIGRRRLFGAAALARSLVVTVCGIALGAYITGALLSPLVPMLFAPVGVAFAAFGRGRGAAVVLGALVAAIAALWTLPPAFPPLPAAPQAMCVAVAVIAAALLLRVGVASLSDAHAHAAASLAAAGDEVVAAARARGEALAALGAEVAHEVKNPLAAIRALVELVREQAGDNDRRRLDVAAGEVARIEAIVRDYLSFARPHGELRRAPIDVAAVVGPLALMFEPRAARAGIALTAHGPPLTATVDAARVKEAVVNLLVNAIEATPAGGSVALSWRRDGDAVVLAVADTGAGMTDAELDALGRPWTTGRDGGTGLGVMLARRVAEAHGGALTYTSRPGAGTTAALRLPPAPETAP